MPAAHSAKAGHWFSLTSFECGTSSRTRGAGALGSFSNADGGEQRYGWSWTLSLTNTRVIDLMGRVRVHPSTAL